MQAQLIEANAIAAKNHIALIKALGDNALLSKKIHSLSLTQVATSSASPVRSSGSKRRGDVHAEEQDEGGNQERFTGDENQEEKEAEIEQEVVEQEGPEVREELVTQENAMQGNGGLRATTHFDPSSLKGVALSTILFEWNVKQLDRGRFLQPTKYKANIAKLNKVVKYAKRWADENTRAVLNSKAPHQTDEPDEYIAWKQTLKVAAADAERVFKTKLEQLEADHPPPAKPHKPNAKAATIKQKKNTSVPRKSVSVLSHFVYALESRLTDLITRRVIAQL